MQTHVVQLTKQRLSDFFVKEEGHVAHKNALVAGTVASGAILASLMLAPDAAACKSWCGPSNGAGVLCDTQNQACCSGTDLAGNDRYWCVPKGHPC